MYLLMAKRQDTPVIKKVVTMSNNSVVFRVCYESADMTTGAMLHMNNDDSYACHWYKKPVSRNELDLCELLCRYEDTANLLAYFNSKFATHRRCR